MQGKNTKLRTLHVLLLLAVALLVTACGSDSSSSTATEQPGSSVPSTASPTPTEEPEESGGVIRTIRGAPGAVWDGISWVWDRGSDGVNAVWDGLRSAGDFLWDQVTGLPSSVWDVITSFWRWLVSSDAGNLARVSVEQIKKLNPGSWFDGIMGFLRNLVIGILKIVGVIALIVLLAFGVIRWRLWMHVVRLFWGSAEKGLSKIPAPGTPPQKPVIPGSNVFKPAVGNEGDLATGVSSPFPVTTMQFGGGSQTEAGWSRSQIHELRELVSNQTIIVLFGRASRSLGKPVNDVELMRAVGRSRAQVRADISAFARVCNIVNPEGTLPIETVEATSAGSSRAYTVPDQYLEWWFED